MKSDNRLHSASSRQEKPPNVAGENSHALCHFERVAPGRTSPTKKAVTAIPIATVKQKAMKNSADDTGRFTSTCAPASWEAHANPSGSQVCRPSRPPLKKFIAVKPLS